MDQSFTTLPETFILSPLVCFSKKRLFEEVASCASQLLKYSESDIIRALNEREKLGSTIFAAGIAAPHAALPGIDHTTAILAILDHPVPFNTIDSDPQQIDIALCFFLATKEDHGVLEQRLGKLTEILSSSELVNSLRRSCHDGSKLMLILQKVDKLLTDQLEKENALNPPVIPLAG